MHTVLGPPPVPPCIVFMESWSWGGGSLLNNAQPSQRYQDTVEPGLRGPSAATTILYFMEGSPSF